MKALLSFEQAPPIDVPLRFLLSAVPFGVATGVLLMFSGEALASRWSPQSLALTHLLTLGLMLQAMCGALLQLTPVAVGACIWRPRAVASWVHPLLLLGASCLAAAFLSSVPALFKIAALFLGLGLAGFTAIVLVALLRTPARNPSHHAIRLAVIGLLIAAVLGIGLALARGGVSLGPDLLSTTQHLRFGLIGWGLALVCGAGFLVVPMFQLTPQYPARFQRAFIPLLGLALLAGILPQLPTAWSSALLALFAAGFAALTLSLQQRRRRPRIDASFLFWRIALCSTLAAAVLAALLPGFADPSRFETLLGVLVLLGGFTSVICAMSYKIVPFLVWLHLNNAGAQPLLMHQVIEEKKIVRHLRIHLAALLLALPVPWWPALAIPAGALLTCAHLVQAANLYRACARYAERLGATRAVKVA